MYYYNWYYKLIIVTEIVGIFSFSGCFIAFYKINSSRQDSLLLCSLMGVYIYDAIWYICGSKYHTYRSENKLTKTETKHFKGRYSGQ